MYIWIFTFASSYAGYRSSTWAQKDRHTLDLTRTLASVVSGGVGVTAILFIIFTSVSVNFLKFKTFIMVIVGFASNDTPTTGTYIHRHTHTYATHASAAYLPQSLAALASCLSLAQNDVYFVGYSFKLVVAVIVVVVLCYVNTSAELLRYDFLLLVNIFQYQSLSQVFSCSVKDKKVR